MKPKQKIKAVIFDMNGVLALGVELKKGTSFAKSFHEIVSKELNINLDKWIDAIDTSYAKSIEGKISEKKLKESISENLDVPKSKLEKAIINSYKKIFKENEELYDFAFGLKKRGIKIAILSDQWHFSKKAIYNPKKIRRFNAVITSCDMGIRKPNPKIYRAILKKLSIRPSESVFIDNREWNLEPAKKLGMKTVLFKNNSQAIKEIEKIIKNDENVEPTSKKDV